MDKKRITVTAGTIEFVTTNNIALSHWMKGPILNLPVQMCQLLSFLKNNQKS